MEPLAIQNNIPAPLPSTPKERAQALAQFFPGRPDAYALQQPNGKYICVRELLSPEILEAHCQGKHTIGVYPLVPDGRVRFGAIDVDQDDARARETVLCVKRTLAHFNIPSFIEPSGRKGFHLWVLFKEFTLAGKARRLFLGAIATLPDAYRGVPLEVFPKQDTADDLGNLIKLPWGKHCVTGRWTTFVDEAFQPLPDGGLPALLATNLATEEDVDHAITELPQPSIGGHSGLGEGQGRGGSGVWRLLLAPMEDGSRNDSLTRIAGWLHLYHPAPVVLALLLVINEGRCTPPLEASEVERIATSVSKYPTPGAPGHPRAVVADFTRQEANNG